MARSKFEIIDSGVAELFHAPHGDVNRHMQRTARRIVLLAKRNVGVHTGRTRASISYKMLNAGGDVLVEVTARSPAALLHHRGSRPHVILPQRGRTLKFKSGGRVVYARQVVHPGTRPNPYLLAALREVVQ